MMTLLILFGVLVIGAGLLVRYRTEWVATKMALAARRRQNRRRLR